MVDSDYKKRLELVQLLGRVLETLSDDEQQEVLSHARQKADGIPISTFRAKLSSLEIIVRYLRDVSHKSFKEIAVILNRKLPTIYTTYQKSHKKYQPILDVSDRSVLIPFSVVHDRTYSILENIVAYLKEKEQLSITQISVLLHRDYNTIQTVYRRYRAKNAANGHGKEGRERENGERTRMQQGSERKRMHRGGGS